MKASIPSPSGTIEADGTPLEIAALIAAMDTRKVSAVAKWSEVAGFAVGLSSGTTTIVNPNGYQDSTARGAGQ